MNVYLRRDLDKDGSDVVWYFQIGFQDLFL